MKSLYIKGFAEAQIERNYRNLTIEKHLPMALNTVLVASFSSLYLSMDDFIGIHAARYFQQREIPFEVFLHEGKYPVDLTGFTVTQKTEKEILREVSHLLLIGHPGGLSIPRDTRVVLLSQNELAYMDGTIASYLGRQLSHVSS